MAAQHHKPETYTPSTRCYTVGYVSDAKYQPVPSITLKGHWLLAGRGGIWDGDTG